MVTILDVLDNFLSSRATSSRNIARIPGKALYELGEEVRRFAREYSPTSPGEGLQPAYLGGWPSANFWDSQSGDLAMASLLYSGSLLAKDPISDWFSMEQYAIPTKMAARPGFISPQTGKPNITGTRIFLSIVIPALYRLRPLIDSGILVLVPSKAFIARHLHSIDKIAEKITLQICSDMHGFTHRFQPHDLPMEDNIRGMIPFAGGNRKEQIQKAVLHSVKYFAAEHLLASSFGYVYTAPFAYESYLCEECLGPTVAQATGSTVLQGVFRSRLRLFQGLTPEIVASIRDDDNFGLFRSQLYQTYSNIPSNCTQAELDQYITEAEEALIAPCLSELEREVTQGVLSKIGINFKQAATNMGIGVLAGLAFSAGQDIKTIIASTGAGAIAGFCSSFITKRPSGPQMIWKRLFDHNSKLVNELPHSKFVDGTHKIESSRTELWGIPEKASMKLHISSGILIMDTVRPSTEGLNNCPDTDYTGSSENPYGLCPCKSGLKYKFCCKDLEKIDFSANSRPSK